MKLFTKAQISIDNLSSLLLFLGVILALIISNNDNLLSHYRNFVNYKFSIGYGPYVLDKTVLKFVNDGLMAIFFFFLGLEMKYHITEGEFRERKSLLFPTITAIGGFIIPALLYSVFNYHSVEGKIGWAIPVATDTAFVLAILSLLGNKISNNMKVFVLGLSIIDDVLAVLVLAIFYTPNLDVVQLALCSLPLGFLTTLNLRKSYNKYLYYLGGIILWVFVVKSGIHGTIAGILLAFFIPTKVVLFDRTIHLIKEIESSIHSIVSFFVLPLFAFVNCELSFKELSINDLFSPISIGCFVGLFIGLLAFDLAELENQMKLGVLLASLISALIGIVLINISHKYKKP